MTKTILALVVAFAVVVPWPASACAVAIPWRALRHDVEAADLIVLAVARESSSGTGWVETIEFDIVRAFKGQPNRQIRVAGICDKICWTTCFTADAPVILFLTRHPDDRSAWEPRYQLIQTQLEVLTVRNGHVATPVPPWKDHGVTQALELDEFEKLVREVAFAEREPPLTYRFVY